MRRCMRNTPLAASFQGRLNTDYKLRIQLRELDKQKVRGLGRIEIRYSDVSPPQGDSLTYSGLLQSSHFGFAPRGDALFSYRFSELAAAGVLPIVLSDGWALPFEQLIDWSRLSIRVPQSNVSSVLGRLSTLSHREVCQRRAELYDAYHTYLKGPKEWAHAMVQLDLQSSEPPHVANFRRALESLPPIPKIVHLTWKVKFDILRSSNPMVKEGIRQLSEMNPSWRVELSDDNDVHSYLKRTLPMEDYKRLKKVHPVELGDLWRLVKMCREGGLYMDIDRLSNMPISSYVHGNTTRMVVPTFQGFSRWSNVWNQCSKWDTKGGEKCPFNIAQDFMCSAPGNPVFCKAMEANLKRRASCQRRFPSERVRSTQPGCKIYDDVVEYTNVATEVMIGERLEENAGGEKRRRMERALESLKPLVTTYAEHPPLDTIQYRNRWHLGRDWFDKGRQALREEAKTVNWYTWKPE